MTFSDEGAVLLPELVALRRELHADPEVGVDLPRTQQRILDALDGLGLEISTGQSLSSVVAVLRGTKAVSGQTRPTAARPAILLRGDMDALPVAEQTGLDFASTNGAMHACGHDLHVAGLVGAAKLLSAHRDELAGDVIFMFQPGEEGDGGAEIMIEEGLLDATGTKPIAAYGIHVAPGPRGVFGTRPGTLMAGANELRITVHGQGGHGSQPHSAKDPVPALTAIATNLQAMATRRFSALDPVVVTVTQLSAGEAINVIPDSASLGATVRTLSAKSVENFAPFAKELADGIAAGFGCTAEVDFRVQYPVTVNDADSTATVMTELGQLFGPERVTEMKDPLMGSEDFSFVLNQVPGTFLFLLCSPPELDPATAAWNHSPRVLFDDAVLGDQAAALAQLAFNRLAS